MRWERNAGGWSLFSLKLKTGSVSIVDIMIMMIFEIVTSFKVQKLNKMMIMMSRKEVKVFTQSNVKLVVVDDLSS